jgi:fructose-1,6-bisphosphatase I
MATRVTVKQHTQQLKTAPGGLVEVLAGVARAATRIEAKIRTAGLSDIYGAAGAENVQGEEQQKLDVYANDTLIEILGKLPSVLALVSEEDPEPVTFGRRGHDAHYIVVFDPLDGSSNIDVNVNVGTIFSVLRCEDGVGLTQTVLQPGTRQVAAGYVVYGPSTVMVLTLGDGVSAYTLDPVSGEFLLSSARMVLPEQGPYYSANEANQATWPGVYGEFVASMREGRLGRTYSSRYIGSLVADFHRTLLKGGCFLYPPTEKQPKGKLRLLYEANPLSMVIEQAGGMAITGAPGVEGGRVLALKPVAIHQRTPFVFGSRREIETLETLLASVPVLAGGAE